MNTEGLYTRKKVENMSTSEVIKYMNDNFGGLKNFYVYARIVEITKDAVVTIPEYFLMNDSTARKAIIASDVDEFHVKMIREDKKRNQYVRINGSILDVNKHIIYSMLVNQPTIDNKDNKKRDINDIFIFKPSLVIKDSEQAETIRTFYRDNNITLHNHEIFINQEDNIESIILRPLVNKIYERKANEAYHYRETLNDQIKKNEKKKKEQEEEIEEIDKIILDLKSTKDNNEKIINKQKENINELEKIYKDKEKSLSKEMDLRLENLKSKIQLFEEFLSPVWNNNTNKLDNALSSYDNFDELINHIQKFLYEKYHLYYNRDILNSIYLGIQTGQLILLVGHPGTGKSSLAQYIPTAFGSPQSAMIPVQPSWSDKEDLLGYYNSLEKTYISTHFLDALIKTCHLAAQYTERIFFICLDEMNLAHIEYYFSEFLSILQGNRVLNLYSKNIENDIKIELQYNGFSTFKIDPDIFKREKFNSLSILEKKYYLSLCRMATMLAKYPASIKIPSNIVFIGTLNQDATTHDISPKVLDRSFVIRLEDPKETPSLDMENFQTNPVEYKPLSEFNPIHREDEVEEYYRGINEAIKRYGDIDDIFKFSTRVMNVTFANKDFFKWCQVGNPNEIIDYIYTAMFLPRLRLDEKRFSRNRKILDEMGKNFPLFDRIYHMIINDGELDYWRD